MRCCQSERTLLRHWEGGMWTYDAQHNSIISAGNGGTMSTQAAFTIFYNQGTARYDLEKTLQPDDQMWIDIGKLIREHIPDKNGKTLPADLATGAYEFRDLNDKFIGGLFEGKVIYDRTYGHVTYGCGQCCPYDLPFLGSNPLNIPFASTSPNTVWATSCNGINMNVSAKFTTNWSTVNSGIATVDAYGVHTGVAAGSTSTNTSGYLLQPGIPKCPILLVHASGGDNVGPYQVEPIATASQYPPAICAPGQTGWQRNVTNQLQYSNGSACAHAGITTADILSIGSRNDLHVTSVQGGSDVTTGDGSWSDYYYVCSSACPASTGETDALQNWTANGVPLSHANVVIYKCSSISIDGR
jgi:hypothetical protein